MLLHHIAPAPNSATSTPYSNHIATLPILLLNIHTLCNCRCVMCDIWQRKQSRGLSVAGLKRHRDSLIQLSVRQVVLTGGEPLLNHDLQPICEFLRELRIHITLLTSGLLLHKRAFLVASMVDEVILSLDGPPEVHNAIRGIPRAFETTAKGVASIRNLRPGIPISCRTTVQQQNHKHLRTSVQTAHLLGLDSISFLAADLASAAFNRDPPWNSERQKEVALNEAELQELHNEVELLISTCQADLQTRFIAESAAKLRLIPVRFREYLEGSSPQSPICNAPWVSAVLEVDGTLRPCFFHPRVSSTEHLTLEQAVNSQAARSFRAGLDVATNPICQRCVCSLNYKPNSRADLLQKVKMPDPLPALELR